MSYLGNAIIGYLITRFIYEDDRNLPPSEITLLRNNLVNNNLFASLALKYKLAKHIKSKQCERMKQKEADFCNSEYFRYIQVRLIAKT